jgi:predicted RNA-binding Zn ribbon-like protein
MGTIREFEPKDFVGGHEAIDLVNTVTARDADPVDRLENYGRLLRWTSLTGVFSEHDIADLKRLADTETTGAAHALEELKKLREALYKVITALMANQHPDEQALHLIEGAWKTAIGNSVWAVHNGRVVLSLPPARAGLDYIRQAIALTGYELLCALRVERTRLCPGERCGWLFIDDSKGGRRRWCDMSVCGNVAKSRRYQQKKKRASRRHRSR